jgi:iron complex outermembrane receptor protein
MKLNLNHALRGCFSALIVLFVSSAALAQTTVTGTITDGENGDPLIGASIVVTGTSTGTVTDFDGNFTLNVPEGAESLSVSYTGYGTQTIPFTGQTIIDVALTSGELLDEVVVVGYGTVTQKEVTSAVTSIDSEDFNAGNINDPTQLIQGKVAGLTISRPGGNSNGESTIRLRGLSSFGGNQSPLIIIDGVVGADLNTVDPADIASVNVLKDGSAAAIYGIQASAGVIIVTTKRGRAGAPQISYRGYISAEEVAKAQPVASAAQYLDNIERVGDINYQRALDDDVPADELPSTGAEVRASQNFGGNTDWFEEVTRTGISHVHNLSYSGGADATTYRASINYRNIQGIGFTNDGFRQVNGRVSVNTRAINDRLSLSIDVTATDRRADLFEPAVFQYATTYNPTFPVFANDPSADVPQAVQDQAAAQFGGFTQVENFQYFNPVAIGTNTRRERNQRNLLYSFRSGFDITDDWVIEASYSRNTENGVDGYIATRESYFAGNAAGDPAFRGFAERRTNDDRNELFEVTTTYDLNLGASDLELLGGYSWQEYQDQNFFIGGRGLPSNAFGFNRLGVLNDFVSGNVQENALNSGQGTYRVIGFFGRARLGIGTAYNVTASIRRDGTSRNGPENKWDIFPAISASADLVDALALNGPDALKVRIGYGITGSLPNGNYGYLQTFNVGRQVPVDSVTYVASIAPTSNANPNLKFEKKAEINFGIDFSFLDYRLNGSLDIYRRNTGDLITNVPLPTPPFLFETVEANLNNVDLINQGVELAVSYNMGDLEGDGFSWTPSLAFSTFSTKLEDNGETPDFNFGAGGVQIFESSSPGSPGQNGDPISQIRIGEEFGGLYTRVLDVPASVAAGRYVFVNQNGDIDDDGNPIINNDDKVLVGNGLPDFSASLANSFSYRNWDLNIFLRGDFGHSLANLPANFYGQAGNAISRPNDNIIISDRFQPNIVEAPRFSDYFVEKASFVALDNAQLGYTFDMANVSGFSSLRVYVAGQNLFYITNYSGVDPNVRFFDDRNANGVRDFNENPLTPGLDRRTTFFRTRTYTLGLSLGF